jgi:hypothetical protein
MVLLCNVQYFGEVYIIPETWEKNKKEHNAWGIPAAILMHR